MRRRILPLALAGGLVFFSSGCSIFRRKRAAPSPPPPPVAAPIPEPKASAPIVSAPKVSPPALETPPQDVQVAPPPPPPPETPKPKPRRRFPRRPVESVPQPKPEVPAQPPAAMPRLGEVLTAKQRQELAAQLDGNVAEASRILAALAGRTPTREQYETAARVRSFIQQALDMKNSDIGTAVELSRRALLLARDLAASR